MRLRKRTQEREVRHLKRAAAAHALANAPGLREHRRSQGRIWAGYAALVVGLAFLPFGGRGYYFALGLASALFITLITRETAFKRGSDYVGIKALEKSIQDLDAVCAFLEETLAPHHPDREAANAQRAALIRFRDQAIRGVR
jgi:hypothetical protein